MNATANRKRRLRNRKANYDALCRRYAKRVSLRCGSRPYYEAFDVRIEFRRGSAYRVTWKERATAEYSRVIRQLIEMSKGMTVKLPFLAGNPETVASSPVNP